LHFVDPENLFKEKQDEGFMMRYHYAAWFYMIDDFDNSQLSSAGYVILRHPNRLL
jgi:hypothetical protein